MEKPETSVRLFDEAQILLQKSRCYNLLAAKT